MFKRFKIKAHYWYRWSMLGCIIICCFAITLKITNWKFRDVLQLINKIKMFFLQHRSFFKKHEAQTTKKLKKHYQAELREQTRKFSFFLF